MNNNLLALDPYEFDQTDAGWSSLDKQGLYIEAARIIELYIDKKSDVINNQSSVSIQTIHFHAAQEYAMAGVEHYPTAVMHCKQAYKDEEAWNTYVNGTIAFLSHNSKQLAENTKKLKKLASANAKLEFNAQLLQKFLDSLQNGKRSYGEMYDES